MTTIVMSPMMKRETKNQADSFKHVTDFMKYLATEPQGGLRHVEHDLSVATKTLLRDGKTDLLSSLQHSREITLDLCSHINAEDISTTTLDATIAAAQTTLELASRALQQKQERRSSLVPTLQTILPPEQHQTADFSEWYETLFDSNRGSGGGGGGGGGGGSSSTPTIE